MATLERAIELATEVHEGQFRFDGSPYITHPLWVMRCVESLGHSVTTQMVAVMHDAVEDSGGALTFDQLRDEGFGDDVVYPLQLLTKEPDADYDLYVQRLAPNPRSRAVKKGDLFHNLDLTGLENPSLDQILRIEKYSRSLLYLARFPQPRV